MVKITSAGGTLADCVIKGNRSSTYYARGTAVMLYGGVMDSCVIVSNTSANSHAPVYLDGGSAPVEMRNCLVAHNQNSADAVFVAGDCKFRTLISNCTIADNRASAGKTGYNALRISSQSANDVTNVVVENTIIVNNLCSGGTISYGYPNWMVSNAAMTNRFSNCLAAVPPNSSCITGEPQFVDPGCLDYSAYPSSPAIDAGVANDNVRDLPGLARPSGAGIDIGAYEYDQSRFSTSFAVNETYALAGTPITCLSTTFGSSAAGNLAYAWSVTNLTTGATFTGTEADFTLAGSSAGLYDVVLTVTDDGVNPAAVATFSPAEPVSRSVATMYVTPGNEANEQFPYDTPAKGAALLTTAYKHALDNTTLMLEPGIHPLTVQFIVRKGVKFIGHGENRPAIIKQTTSQERVLYIDHEDAYFENLAVTGGRKGSNSSTRDNDLGPSTAATSENISHCASVDAFGVNAVVCADPLFTDPATLDFTFGFGSALRNAGVGYDGARNARDYLGRTRVSGGTIDIGATEYQEPATVIMIC
jgi:hypothetical protein